MIINSDKMKAEISIRRVLENSSFGLKAAEISSKTGMNERTVSKVLDEMASQKKIKRTKAGREVFYRSIKYAALLIIIFSFAANAQEMNSSSYKLQTVLDSAGIKTQGTSYVGYGSIGQVSGLTASVTYDLCAGFLCNFIEFITNAKVTFLLNFNISGNANDVVYVDNFTALKQYRGSSLVNPYSCLQDSSIASTPTFGIIFAGTALNYINVSSGTSYAMRVSQDIQGNEFILPVTYNNCTVLNARIPQIFEFGKILQPFVLVSEMANAIELSLEYSSIDIVGILDRTGSFTLDIQKNETNEDQIIIKPV